MVIRMKRTGTVFWEEIEIGRVLQTDPVEINAGAIRIFAEKFDPQPYHLDREAGEASLFGGLCASGWHITAVMMKLVSDELEKQHIPLLGSNEVNWLDWHKPVFDGDSIYANVDITAKKMPAKSSDHGLIECDISVKNQNKIKVMSLSADLMIESNGKINE